MAGNSRPCLASFSAASAWGERRGGGVCGVLPARGVGEGEQQLGGERAWRQRHRGDRARTHGMMQHRGGTGRCEQQHGRAARGGQ